VLQAEANRDLALDIPISQIRTAEAQVAAAQAEKDVLQEQYDVLIRNDIGGAPEEQARFALNAAVASLNAAQAVLDELNAGPSTARRRVAIAAVDVAVAQREAAEIQLDLLLSEPASEQLESAQAEIARAEEAVTQAEAAVSQAEAVVTQAEAGVLQAQAAVDAASAALDKLVLKAPFAGVIADLGVEVGETVAPGVPVLTLADLSIWSVETTDLTERDVVAIAVGQQAQIRVDALPEQTITGTVSRIADVAALTRGDVTYAVTIQLDAAATLPLRWGMTAFVDIEADS
jgi:HlyD family secretion protein